MKSRAKQARGRRHPVVAKESGVFVVPSHGRLARRGSTEIVVEDDFDSHHAGKSQSGASR